MTMCMKPFSFTNAIRVVCEDICFRLPEFSHVNMTRVGISFTQTRHNQTYGVFASLTPLRFEEGRRVCQRRGAWFCMPTMLTPSKEVLFYILTFYQPRFQNMTPQKKIETTIHELYHIGKNFDGDYRRFQGRCTAHGSSQKKYDQIVEALAQEWLQKNPPPEIWDFLRYDFSELQKQYGSITGTRYRIPRLVPISKENAMKICAKTD